MAVITGALLVMLTWLVGALVVMSWGVLLATATSPGASRLTALRRSLWWGLVVGVLLVTAVSLFLPLHSLSAALLLLGSAVILGVPGWISWTKRSRGVATRDPRRWGLVAALVIAQVYLGIAALGPVTGYDSGLYHLGAIKYASDFPALHGIANLYGPLGYGTAEFPLAAVFGNGPWAGEGFRLINGFILLLVACDLVLRLMRRRLTPGTFVLITGVVAAWVPMIALSDFWVTSPSQDSPVLALCVVMSTYLVDAVAQRQGYRANLVVAFLIGLVIVMLRSTMAGYVIAFVVVGVVLLVRRERGGGPGPALRSLAPAAAIAVLSAAVMVGRDYLLSGWLLYPLSIHAFSVPWVAPDPTGLREATLGFARDPANIWESVSGLAWLPSWLSRLPREWAFAEFAVLLVATVALLAVTHRLITTGRLWRLLLLSAVPSAVAVGIWWLTSPPAFRFAWGPLFTLAAIPLGWCLYLLAGSGGARPRAWLSLTLVGAALTITADAGYSALARFDWNSADSPREWTLGVSLPYSITPIPNPPVIESVLPSGLRVLSPTESDQCWNTYPLCTPSPANGLRQTGPDISSGFSSNPS